MSLAEESHKLQRHQQFSGIGPGALKRKCGRDCVPEVGSNTETRRLTSSPMACYLARGCGQSQRTMAEVMERVARLLSRGGGATPCEAVTGGDTESFFFGDPKPGRPPSRFWGSRLANLVLEGIHRKLQNGPRATLFLPGPSSGRRVRGPEPLEIKQTSMLASMLDYILFVW